MQKLCCGCKYQTACVSYKRFRQRPAIIACVDIQTKELQTQKSGQILSRGVVIVGGGPAGLATSLVLAQRGWKDITILEALPEHKLSDPNRSFQYYINGRGLRLLKHLDLQDKLYASGLAFQDMAGMTEIKPEGIKYLSSMPLLTDVDLNVCMRVDLIDILKQKINSDYSEEINCNFDIKHVDLQKQGNRLILTFQIHNQEQVQMEPLLIVGCDGYKSLVRQKLQQITDNTQFQLETFELPFSGKRYKVLQLLRNFYLDHSKKNTALDESDYLITGKSKEPNKQMMFISLASPKALQKRELRIGVIWTPAEDHILWKLDTGEKILNYFEEEFPQLPIRDIISKEEAQNFAICKGGQYPQGGYCKNAAYSVSIDENEKTQGVVLVGDSLHHFPPNKGQGVNAAFEDALVLNDVLDKNNNDLRSSLKMYEELRTADAKGLLECYRGPKSLSSRQYLLFNIVFFNNFQEVLHKRFSTIFPPPINNYLDDNKLRYSETFFKQQKALNIYYGFLGVIVMFLIVIFGVIGQQLLAWWGVMIQ